MSEGQMILMFCVAYSGALTLVVWANLVTREKLRAHLRDPEQCGESPDRFQQGA